jgi:hypothetical protein
MIDLVIQHCIPQYTGADAIATAPPLDKPVFVTRPFFGIDNNSPLYDDYDEGYYSDEDDGLEEALEQLEYDSGESALGLDAGIHTDRRSFSSFTPLYLTLYNAGLLALSSLSSCHQSNNQTPNVVLDLNYPAAFYTQAQTTNTGDTTAAV